MSEDLTIPARIDNAGAIRFGQPFVPLKQTMNVHDGVLVVHEYRQYDDGTRDSVLVGRFKLTPLP